MRLIGDLQRFKAEYLKAMAHPVRIRVLEILRQGEAAVAEVGSQVGGEVANLSQHLAVLRGAGIVAARKAGLSVLYSVRDAEVFAILDALRAVFTHRADSMRHLLAEDDSAAALRPPARRSRRAAAAGGSADSGPVGR